MRRPIGLTTSSRDLGLQLIEEVESAVRKIEIDPGIGARYRSTKMRFFRRVGLERTETGSFMLLGRTRPFLCGTSMPFITIPVIPINVPKYAPRTIEIGEVEGFPVPHSTDLPCDYGDADADLRSLTSDP